MSHKQTDKIITGFYLNESVPETDIRKKNILVNKYFPYSNKHSHVNICTNLNSSVIFTLVKAITDNTTGSCYIPSIYSDNFYYSCIENNFLNYKLQFVADNELLLVYLKQTNNILRNADIISEPLTDINKFSMGFYLKLFTSFWNSTDWTELFPSMPDLAYLLFQKRHVIRELLINQKNKFRADCFSSAVFKSTGIKNNLLNISFIDFSIYTWLSHFDIIRYIPGEEYSPVMLELTNHGRIIMKYLMNE
jgi:hypothetical protein